MNILKDMGTLLKGLMAKVPTVIQSGYYVGERVEYIDHSIKPIHYGTITRTWNDKVKVTFDGFENGTWLDIDAIQRLQQ